MLIVLQGHESLLNLLALENIIQILPYVCLSSDY